jgi:hypothetical protein
MGQGFFCGHLCAGLWQTNYGRVQLVLSSHHSFIIRYFTFIHGRVQLVLSHVAKQIFNLIKAGLGFGHVPKRIFKPGTGVGLQKMMAYHKIQKWVEEVPRSEIKIFLELLPFAVIFLCIIIGASQSHFDSGPGASCSYSNSKTPNNLDNLIDDGVHLC